MAVEPTETFRCVIVEVEDDAVHVESVTSDGEEADAWIPLASIDPWRRREGESFTIRVFVGRDIGNLLNEYLWQTPTETVLNEYVWHTPAQRSRLNRKALRECVYPVILSIALGMLAGDTLGAGLTERTGLYLAAILACWTGIYLSRKRPRPDSKPGHMRITSDD